jgi:hypothetical protein
VHVGRTVVRCYFQFACSQNDEATLRVTDQRQSLTARRRIHRGDMIVQQLRVVANVATPVIWEHAADHVPEPIVWRLHYQIRGNVGPVLE